MKASSDNVYLPMQYDWSTRSMTIKMIMRFQYRNAASQTIDAWDERTKSFAEAL